MNIQEHMAEKMELAGIYALDGAYRTAAQILRDLADQLDSHAESREVAIRELLDQHGGRR